MFLQLQTKNTMLMLKLSNWGDYAWEWNSSKLLIQNGWCPRWKRQVRYLDIQGLLTAIIKAMEIKLFLWICMSFLETKNVLHFYFFFGSLCYSISIKKSSLIQTFNPKIYSLYQNYQRWFWETDRNFYHWSLHGFFSCYRNKV